MRLRRVIEVLVKTPLLLVDDDRAFRKIYGGLLREAGYEVDEADDRESARAAARAKDYPLILLDLMLPPDGTAEAGLTQLGELLAERPATKVVVASGAGDVRNMLRAVKAGAYDFLTKPVDPDVLATVVARAAARVALERQVEALRSSLSLASGEPLMLGESPAFRQALLLAERVARSELPVLVTGENGTGKELLAKSIHQKSPRAAGPFVAVNCGALPESLLESTLFGHIRGAFTGAVKDRRGLFAEADKGTIFLDEIGDMPPALQVKLLRVLENGEILPVGADKPARVDVRVLSATNKDLAALERDGLFREDLYWRIKGAEVRLPPLRERPEDLPLLAAHFLNRSAHLCPDGRPRVLTRRAQEALLSHAWPGNLRELRHEMQRATVLCADKPEIEPEDLSFVPYAKAPPAEPKTLQEKVEVLERREIEAALRGSAGNRTHAADALGLSRQGLLKKMERYGIK
jgi:two-component system, NtrC family, response regulator AtoC